MLTILSMHHQLTDARGARARVHAGLGERRASGPDALSDAMRAARCRFVVSVFHELHAAPALPHAPSCGLPSARRTSSAAAAGASTARRASGRIYVA